MFFAERVATTFFLFGVNLSLLYNEIISKNNSKTKINLKPIHVYFKHSDELICNVYEDVKPDYLQQLPCGTVCVVTAENWTSSPRYSY